MIHHLKGKLVEKNPTYVVVDCNGVGYFVHISLNTFSKIKDEEQIAIFTHLQVKEDSHTLFGFQEKSEREIFRLLISVSGIGASTARTMLSLPCSCSLACSRPASPRSRRQGGKRTEKRLHYVAAGVLPLTYRDANFFGRCLAKRLASGGRA